MKKLEKEGGEDRSAVECDQTESPEEFLRFYERTGAMPVSTIGPPIDRPIIPLRRPDRVGDFVFSPDLDDRTGGGVSSVDSVTWTEYSEIRQRFLEILDGVPAEQ